MRADVLNSHVYPVKKQILTSHICSTYESKLKEFPVEETLSQICSTDEDESKGIIVVKCYTEEDESECVYKNINKQKDAKNEAEYEEYSVTNELPSYFNRFEWGRNLLNRIDVTYEQACMFAPKEKYYTNMLETLIDYNDHHNVPLSNEKLRQAVSKVMSETQ